MSNLGPDCAISVVVPTFNRSSNLSRLVSALKTQVNAPPFELIVVDDASTDDTWKTLATLERNAEVDLRPLRLDSNGGPATARNAGWRASRGVAIAFTDDDCVPQPGWLAALWRRLEEFDFVQGRTLPSPEQLGQYSWFALTVAVEYERGFYETCNIAYRRDVLDEIGGFDAEFQYPFGEDVDLAWRAKAAGRRSVFEPDAVVWHDIHPGSLRSRLRGLRRQESLVLALRRHPRLRAHFDNRWFYQRSHPRALTLLAGLASVAFRPASLVSWLMAAGLAVPWLAYRGAMVARGQRLAVLPRLLVLDVAETASFARASVRYRTLLL